MVSSKNGFGDDDFISSYDDLQDRDIPRIEDVYVPEFGKNAKGQPKKIRVTAMSDFERRRFVGMGTKPDPKDPTTAIRNMEFYDSGEHDIELLWRSCRKPDGSELLSKDQWMEEMRARRNPAPFVRLVAAALRVNVLDDESFQEARKNSPPPSATAISG